MVPGLRGFDLCGEVLCVCPHIGKLDPVRVPVRDPFCVGTSAITWADDASAIGNHHLRPCAQRAGASRRRRGLETRRSSPGDGFFSAFVEFDPGQLEQRNKNSELLAGGKFGEPTDLTVIFNGRSPVGIHSGVKIDVNDFKLGRFIPLGPCQIRPKSNLKNWGQSLLITSPSIVLNKARTWDPCTGAGTRGGKWTFAHLVREMAAASGSTAEQFTLAWLAKWLNNYTVNSDVVPRRLQMFDQGPSAI